MKSLLISKFPPIEGYVSSLAYWLARGLSGRGHRIQVITNAFEVEDRFREAFEQSDLDQYQTKMVKVRNTDPFQNYQLIPGANPFCEKLAAAALGHARDARLVDSWYFLSYGTAAMTVKAVTGLPLIVRHAASDIARLGANIHLRPLIGALLSMADAVVAQPGAVGRLKKLGARNIRVIPVSVDTDAFSPKTKAADTGAPENVPVITYIGKSIRGKGLPELLRAVSGIRDDFRLMLVSSGAREALKGFSIHSTLANRIIFGNFLPPWRMPGIIRASRAVVLPEFNFPVRTHVPILPREVLACGTCLALSEELATKVANGRLREDGAIVVKPEKTAEFTARLSAIVRDEKLAGLTGNQGLAVSGELENFRHYILENEKMYRELTQTVRLSARPGRARPFS